MSFRVEWTHSALDRMELLLHFIARNSPKAAQRIIDDLFDRVAILGEQPELGHPLEALGEPTLRQMYFGAYRVVYLVDQAAHAVFVLAVQHGKEAPYTPEELEELAADAPGSQ